MGREGLDHIRRLHLRWFAHQVQPFVQSKIYSLLVPEQHSDQLEPGRIQVDQVHILWEALQLHVQRSI